MDGQVEQAVDAIFLLTRRPVFHIFSKYKQTQPNRDLSNSPITSILNHKEYCRELAQPAQPARRRVFCIFSKFGISYFFKIPYAVFFQNSKHWHPAQLALPNSAQPSPAQPSRAEPSSSSCILYFFKIPYLVFFQH